LGLAENPDDRNSLQSDNNNEKVYFKKMENFGCLSNYWNYFIKENNITKPSVRYSRVIIIIQDLQQLKEKLIGKYGKEDGGKQK